MPIELKVKDVLLSHLMNFNFKSIPYIIAGVIIVLILSGSGYYYYQKNQVNKVNPQAAAQEEVKKLVAEVGKLIDLPKGEDPTVATVADITKLKDQIFFQKAKNGDKVLIYTNAKKAILYDPITHKIIDMAPLNINAAPTETNQSKVVLRNGTSIAGLTTKIETDLKKVIANLNVIAKEDATGVYDKTMVVVLNSKAADLAQNLAKILNASQSALPAGEVRPKDGDILILIGKDNR